MGHRPLGDPAAVPGRGPLQLLESAGTTHRKQPFGLTRARIGGQSVEVREASALFGTLQFGLAASGSALVGALADGTPRPMALLMLFGVGRAIAAELARPRR